MKRITIKKIELKNFKAISQRSIELAQSGIIASGYNESGKSSIIESIMFCLGASFPASDIINQSTKAPASVTLTIEHAEGLDTFTRSLIPTLDSSGKVTSSTSSYVISGQPIKAGMYATRINELFGTSEWSALLNPLAASQLKNARSILLNVAGCISESDYLREINPELAKVIGYQTFEQFEKTEKAIIEDLGKKLNTVQPRVDELAAMIKDVPSPVENPERAKEILAVLEGIDKDNAKRADQYNKVNAQISDLRRQSADLKSQAAEIETAAYVTANQAHSDAVKALAEFNHRKSIHASKLQEAQNEVNRKRDELARRESAVNNLKSDLDKCAEDYCAAQAAPIQADGFCKVVKCQCTKLHDLGIQAAADAKRANIARTYQAGKDKKKEWNEARDRVEAARQQLAVAESRLGELQAVQFGQAPTIPAKVELKQTTESIALRQQAAELEEKGKALQATNRLEVAKYPEGLQEELKAIHEVAGRVIATQQTNEQCRQRIEAIQAEGREWSISQLKHKQFVAQLKEFYKSYADSVTSKVDAIFEGTGYNVRLFEMNMSNDKGVPVMQPMKSGSANLSTAINLIFWKLFIERVLAVANDINAPILIDNSEGVDSSEKLRSEHQVIATRVERKELTITNF